MGATRPRTTAELVGHLRDHFQRMVVAATAFDEGHREQALNLATSLRVLLHQTDESHALLAQLGVLYDLKFVDSAVPIVPGNEVGAMGLVRIRITTDGTTGSTTYEAPLDDGLMQPYPRVLFRDWWGVPVAEDGKDGKHRVWKRKQFVTELVNKEGGGHVDPNVSLKYDALVREVGYGFLPEGDPMGAGNPVFPTVRQIAHEVLTTIQENGERFDQMAAGDA